MTKDEIKVAIKTRFDLLERARADVATTDSDYRLYSTLLLQFYSMDTGQCNPSDAALGKAAGGKCVRTAWEGTNRLGEQGYLFKRRTRGTSYYIFPGLPLPQHLAEDKAVTSAISRENFRKIALELPHTARRTEPVLNHVLNHMAALQRRVLM